MSATTFDALVTRDNRNVRKALKGGVIIGPMTATLPAALTAAATPALQALTGWTGSLGFITSDGAVLSTDVNSSDVNAWGEAEPVRRDITSRVRTLKVTALETNKTVLAAYYDGTPSAADETTGEVTITDSGDLSATYYRVMVLSQDGAAGSETWLATLMPRASVTGGERHVVVAGSDNGIAYGLTFTAYKDATAGYSMKTFLAGPGWLANLDNSGFGS